MAADFAGVGGGGVPTSSDPDGLDGVRMTWNCWPRSKVEASKCVVPIAASISPIRAHPELITLPYSPLRCKPPCSAVLNPYCRVDFATKIWICPLCLSRNHFPHHYSAISESNVPGELYHQCSTVEYDTSSSSAATAPGGVPQPLLPPVFLFVLDTCLIEEELDFVKSAMRRAIGLLPENALVGLVTYGTQVHLHELGFADISKLYVFRGTKEISKDQILEQLGLSTAGRPFVKGAVQPNGMPQLQQQSVMGSSSVNRFLLPASDCEYTLNAVRIIW